MSVVRMKRVLIQSIENDLDMQLKHSSRLVEDVINVEV